MRFFYSSHFKRSLKNFPKEIRQKFEKQIKYLFIDFRHPSLRSKKYDETQNIWQARVDKNIRFYFLTKKDVYILLDIRHHAD